MTSHLVHIVLLLVMAQTPSLDSASPQERREAIRTVAVLGNEEAVPGLVEAYRNEVRRDIRAEIVAGLGRIRDREAVSGLIDAMLTDFQRDIRLQAIDSLLRIYIPIADDEGFFSFIGGVTRIFIEEERPRVAPNVVVDADVQTALVQVLREDFDWEVRREAVYALGSLNATDKIVLLISELEGPRHREDADVRIAIVETMGLFRDQAAGAALTRLIRDEDDRVAERAIEALGLIGFHDAYPELTNLLISSSDDDVREIALQSIALMRHPEAVGLFEPLLDSRDNKERELAAEGLARLDYDASGFSDRIDQEDDDGVRLAQAFALAASGQGVYVNFLVEGLDTRRSTQAEVYLYELGRFEGQIERIYPHLRNPEANVRERLLLVLGRIGNPEARPYIQPLTEDRDGDVSTAAVAALRQMVDR